MRAVTVRHKLGRTPVGSLAQRLSQRSRLHVASPSPASTNRSKSPASSPCRPTRSTGCSATSAGGTGSRPPRRPACKDVPEQSGLEEIFEEISPIEDFTGTMSLSFRDHRFEPPKYSVEECKDKDMTYSAPMFVTAEFINNSTGEIKSQTVFMGDFPLMSPKGTFIINGTERVVVSQLVRSPGVYFDRQVDKTSDKDIYSCKVIPSRGAWLEFEIDKRDSVGVRIDRKRKQSVTVLLKALGWDEAQDPGAVRRVRVDARHPGEGPHPGPGRRAARHLPQAAPGRAADAGVRPGAAGEPVLQPEAVRPGQGRPVQDQQEARPEPADPAGHADRGRHRRAPSSTWSGCTPARTR